MKKSGSIFMIMIFTIFFSNITSSQNSNSKDKFMVRHSVVFKLKSAKNSPEEKEFLSEIRKLSSIPGVKNFECLRQVSKKNNFDYGLSMEFDSQKEYENYSNHPSHNAFVQKYWVTEVEDFMELDFQPF